MNFLRDSIWQFIGAILGAVAIFVAIYIFYRQRQKKSLTYDVVTQTELFSINENIRSDIQVLYKEQPVENIYLVSLRIFNNGNVPIKTSDFERPMRFSFGDKALILSADITDVNPKSINPTFSKQENYMIFEPLLLNSRDSISFTVLLTQHDGSIILDTRIVGVHKIERQAQKATDTYLKFIYATVSSIVTSIILFLVILNLGKYMSTATVIAISAFITSMLFLYIYYRVES